MVQAAVIVFFVIVALALITLILAIVQLINIRAKPGYSTNSSLQTAYDYSIGVLVINIFVFIFVIVALVYYIKAKYLKTKVLTVLTYLITVMVLGSVVLNGLASVAGKETVTIVNLVMGILEFILLVVFIFLLRKVKLVAVELGICNCGAVVTKTM